MLRIQLVDGPRAERAPDGANAGEHGAPIPLPPPAGLRLLVYAIVHRGSPIPRDALAAALWPDAPEARAGGRLRLALHQAATWLEAHAPGSGCLQRTRTTVAWAPSAAVQVDLDALREALRAGGDVRRTPAERRDGLERAVSAGAAPLLPGWDEPWLEAPRRELAEGCAEAIAWLAAASEAELDHEATARLWRLRLDMAPLDENAHRGLMRALVLVGDPAQALLQFDACQRALEGIGAEPHPATRALRDAIAAGDIVLPGIEGGTIPSVAPNGGAAPAPAAPPPPLDRFVGRRAEREALLQRCEDPGVVALVGPGGAGKTRLASEVAWSMSARDDRRIVWVELAEAADGSQVLDAVARAMGIRPTPGSPTLGRVLEALQGGPSLVVLDNCEQVQRTVEDLVGALAAACPHSTLLVTTRIEPTAVDATVVALAGLDAGDDAERSRADASPPAVELFIARMAQRWPLYRPAAEDLGAIGRICRLVDGLPLAIELAVARSAVLDLGAIAEGLAADDADVLRDASGRRVARHRTMDATIGWSYRLLAPDEQRVLRCLAVFAGGIDPEAATAVVLAGDGDDGAVAGTAASAGRAALDRLAAQSLLVRDPAGGERASMLQPIRRYALAALERSGEADAARRRHAAYFTGVVRALAAGTGSDAGAYDALARDLSNIDAALAWLLEADHLEEAVEMVRRLTPFWFHRSHLEWAGGYVQALLDGIAARPAAEQPDATVLHRALSLFAFRRGDIEEAVRRARLVAEYQRQVGDAERYLDALIDLATFLGNLGRFPAALTAAEEAVRLAERQGNRVKRAEALQHAALIHLRVADWDAARAAYDESQTLAREHGLSEANILLGRGTLAQLAGDYAAAEALDLAALAQLEALGDRSGAARVHNNLGRLYNDMGRHGAAMASLRRALAAARDTGRRDVELFALNNMGEVELRKGNLASAALLLERSAELKRDAGNAYSLAFTLLGLAELALARDDPGAAERALAEARAGLAGLGAADVEAWADRLDAERLLAAGEPRAAGAALERALRSLAALGARRELACALDVAARLAQAAGRRAEAAWLDQAAGSLREAIGAPRTAHELAARARVVERGAPARASTAARAAPHPAALADEAVARALVVAAG